MPPRERAEALYAKISVGHFRHVYIDDIETAITEHVRALLADDEATIEAMARAIDPEAFGLSAHMHEELTDRDEARMKAALCLAALRRKALRK